MQSRCETWANVRSVVRRRFQLATKKTFVSDAETGKLGSGSCVGLEQSCMNLRKIRRLLVVQGDVMDD